MEVVTCGTKVETKLGNLSGMITAISIRFNEKIYEVTYVLSGKFEAVWLREQEFDVINESGKIKIGFQTQ